MTKADHEHIHRSRLRVDTRKWVCARLSPRKYGDRAALDLGGQDGNPLTLVDVVKRASSGT